MALVVLLPTARAGDRDWMVGSTPKAVSDWQEQAQAADELLSCLGLTRQQARALLPLIEQSAVVHIEDYQSTAELHDELVPAFTDFARQDSLNEGFTPDVERRTAQLNHQAKLAQEEKARRLLALEDQATELLTPTQRVFVEEFHPNRQRSAPPVDARGAVRRHLQAAAAQAQREAQRDELTEAQRALRELERPMNPTVGRVGNLLLHPAAADPLCRLAGVEPTHTMRGAAQVLQQGTPAHPIDRHREQQARVRCLRTEINNWNLINGLHLSVEQIDRVTRVYDATRPALAELKSRGRGPDARRDLAAAVLELETAVEQVLNRGQREVLAEYKACLIPPKNLKDPVRVGQANDSSQLERFLTRARRLTPQRTDAAIDELLAKETEHVGPLPASEQQERRTLLRKTIEDARRLSDVDFAIQKGELAARIARRDRVRELKTEIAALTHDRGLPGPISRFILQPEFIEQLRIRGEQLRRGPLAAGR